MQANNVISPNFLPTSSLLKTHLHLHSLILASFSLVKVKEVSLLLDASVGSRQEVEFIQIV